MVSTPPPNAPELVTSRLLLRGFRDSDLEAFAALNADPRVVEFLPGALTRAESDAMAARIRQHFEAHGFGLWAVETPDHPFAGFIALSIPAFAAPFVPCVEVGWRLAADAWGHGYATEGARAVVEHGFDTLGLDEIVSFTVPANTRSRRIMEKLGMTHDAEDDFDHPRLPDGHRLQRHVLYRLPRARFTP